MRIRHWQGLKITGALAAAILTSTLWPAQARAQAAEDALAIFPADTQQFAYTNLRELRDNPQFPLIEDRLLSPQLKSLEEFLVPVGINPQKDIDEVVLGWRGSVTDTARFFGIAEGEFDPDTVDNYFASNRLPVQHYLGYNLYGFGSGAARDDILFAFLSSNEAAFGRFDDIKALLDVHAGSKPPLSSNQQFSDWENGLEGSAAQWGIATGRAAANEAIPWLTAGRKLTVDANALFEPIKAVLYHVDWQSGVAAHLTVICESAQAAQGLDQLLSLLRTARMPAGAAPPAALGVVRSMQIQTDGSKLKLDATASLSDLSQLLNAPPSSSGRR